MSLTNADLAQQITGLISRWDTYTKQLRDWLAGTADGGPYGDGRYPLQNSLGQVFYVPCPAAQAAMVEGNATSAQSFATEAGNAALSSAAARTASEAARDLALTYRDAALSAKGQAEYARSQAQNSEINAEYYYNQVMAATANGLQGFSAGPTPPANPDEGHEWLDTNTGVRFTWFNDPDGGQWIELGVVGVPEHDHADYVKRPAVPSDGSLLEFNQATNEWAATTAPRAVLMDGGNF